MSIDVTCIGCSRKLNLPDGSLGNSVRCPICQTLFRVYQEPGGPIQIIPALQLPPRLSLSLDEPDPVKDLPLELAPKKARWLPSVGEEISARREGEPSWLAGVVRLVKGENVYVEFKDGVFELATEVRPAKAASGATASPEPTYITGDRVLGRWLDLWWYPGTVLSQDKSRYLVQFDDGDRSALTELELAPLRVEVGDSVQCRPKTEVRLAYQVGTIARVAGEVIDVEYDDGDTETNTSISRIRLWRCPVPVENFAFSEGDRVLVRLPDGFLYPADILTIEDEAIAVQLMLGGQLNVTPELVRELELAPAARIEGRWRGGDVFFPGRVTEQRNERVFLKYDDGDEEWTTIRLIRVVDEQNVVETPVVGDVGKVGDRVLARWSGNGLWYAGTIRLRNGDLSQVLFEDGSMEWVARAGLGPLDLPTGSEVLVARPGQTQYTPALVRRFDGLRVTVRYPDGMEDAVDLRNVCVARDQPE